MDQDIPLKFIVLRLSKVSKEASPYGQMLKAPKISVEGFPHMESPSNRVVHRVSRDT